MSIRLAYGNKDNIATAIESGTIPTESLIATKENSAVSELYLYDSDGVLKAISQRTKFETLTEAKEWAEKYLNAGQVISVHNGTDWILYVVGDDGSLSLAASATITSDDITCIDGGNSFDV